MWPVFTRVNENLGATYVTRHSALNSIFRDIGKNSTIFNVNCPQPKTDFFCLNFPPISSWVSKTSGTCPRKYGARARQCHSCSNRHDLIRKYDIIICRQCRVYKDKCLFPLLFISCISTKHSPYYFNLNINT